MFARLGFALALLAFVPCALRAQTVTILDQNGQPVEVAAAQFQTVGPHPGVIDFDHLHALNGFGVVGLNNQFVRDPSPDPNGRGYTLANNPGPQAFNADATVSVGLVQSEPTMHFSMTTITLNCTNSVSGSGTLEWNNDVLDRVHDEIQESSGGETKPAAPTGKEGEKPPSK